MDYEADERPMNAELGCQLLLGNVSFGVPFTDLVDFFFSDLGLAVGFASRLSAFVHLVGVIVGLRAQPEVNRIRAGRVIAGVEDAKTIRNWSEDDLPDGTVCVDLLSVVPELSVAFFVAIALVLPAASIVVRLEVAQAFQKGLLHHSSPEMWSLQCL